MSSAARADDGRGSVRRRRVFFALWPDEATRSALARATRCAVRAAGGRATRPENLHITMAFLGGVTPVEFDRARDVPPIGAGPVELTLDTLGHWSRPRILWLAASVRPDPLMTLERSLWEGLVARGFEREKKIFTPHVTLCRRARAVAEAVKPVRWRIERLTLLESIPVERGVRYESIEDWPL